MVAAAEEYVSRRKANKQSAEHYSAVVAQLQRELRGTTKDFQERAKARAGKNEKPLATLEVSIQTYTGAWQPKNNM